MSFHLNLDQGLAPSERYAQLIDAARSLLAGESDAIANAANFAALVYHGLPEVNWAGFYFLRDGQLVVGPFQGQPACVRIPLGRGVCGTAAASGETQVVSDVAAFDGHIACDAATRSEIVVPIEVDDAVIGVFDIDSPNLGRFQAEDREGLEALVAVFAEHWTR